MKTTSRLPKAFMNLITSSHLGSKASVLLVLLMSVFISSGIFVSSVHAYAPGVILYPNTGSSNPLANSGLFPFASGFDDFVTLHSEGIREVAVYGGGGNEPMATAAASASGESTPIGGPTGGWANWNAAPQSSAQITWPYIIMKNGIPLDNTSATGPIPLQLSYRMFLLPEGDAALAYGFVQVSYLNLAITRVRGEGVGPFTSGGDPAEGQISFTFSFEYGVQNYLTVSVYALADAETALDPYAGKIFSWSEAEAVVDPYLRIDPSSPLASQLQVYTGKNYTANANDLSSWTPAVQTPLNFDSIIPISAGTEALAARGLDNGIYYRPQIGAAWQDWNVLPGSTIDSPGAAMLNNHLHTVVRGSDGYTLWHGYLTNASNPTSFSGWTLLDGATSSAPTFTSNGTVLCLVVRGLDNRIFYRCYNGSWQPWHAVPTGATLDSPAAAMLGKDLHIVVRGMDGNSLWDTIVDCNGTVIRNWQLLSGATALKPALASSQGLNETYLVVTGLDNRIFYMNYSGSTDSWGSWTAIPTGATIDGPGATVMGNMLCTVVRGMDGSTLWCGDVNWGTSSFTGWTLLSGASPSGPTLTS